MARLLKIDEETAARTYDLYRSAMTSDGTVSKETQVRFMDEMTKRMKLKESPAVENILNYSTSRKINREMSPPVGSPDRNRSLRRRPMNGSEKFFADSKAARRARTGVPVGNSEVS